MPVLHNPRQPGRHAPVQVHFLMTFQKFYNGVPGVIDSTVAAAPSVTKTNGGLIVTAINHEMAFAFDAPSLY